MNPNLKWKALFVAAVILLCIYGLVGMPAFPRSWQQVKDNFGKRIKLGLDLQGGTHLIIQVLVDEAVGQHNDLARDQVYREMRNRNISSEGIEKIDNTRFLVRKLGPGQGSAFRDMMRSLFAQEWDFAQAAGEDESYTVTLRNSAEAALRTNTMTQAVETIRRRIDQLGLTEPTIALHGRGENEILVQLPGVGNPQQIRDIIQKGGQLEFRAVRGDREFSSEAEALANYSGVLPPNTEIVRGKPGTRQPGVPLQEVFYVLDRTPVVTGRALRNATPSPGNLPGTYQVDFVLSTQAAQRFGQFTGANIGNRLAIVLDRKVESAPVIRGRIEDRGQIEGDFGQEEARDLALVLRSGSLPASIRYLEERTVGPSLGADSIRQGFWASIISLILVMIFMPVYYRKAGLNANAALVLNLVVLLAVLAYLGAVLTLPGIAGVILTIGMGVDSNVLIFERIREELKAGKANASAVDAGFDRAFLTIIDTHVTTIVSAFFLFSFGTGPVKGFAVTLVIGLISNLFTAVYISRMIFGWHLARMERGAELSI